MKLQQAQAEEHEKAQEKLNEKQEEQKKAIVASSEMAQNFMTSVKGSSTQATRFFNALKLELKKVKGALQLTFDSNWIAILARFVMSSKAFTQTVGKMFDKVGHAIDSVLGSLIDTNDEAEELAKRARAIDDEVKIMTSGIQNICITGTN